MHLKILKVVEVPYYLQMGAANSNNKARTSVYMKGGAVSAYADGEESPRRSLRTSGGADVVDQVRGV